MLSSCRSSSSSSSGAAGGVGGVGMSSLLLHYYYLMIILMTVLVVPVVQGEEVNTVTISLSVSSSSSSSSSSCFDIGEPFDVSFDVVDELFNLNNNFDEIWIGIDRVSVSVDDVGGVGNMNNMMWVWLCGSQTCDPTTSTSSTTGTVSFDGQDQMWEPNLWPLEEGTYRAALVGWRNSNNGNSGNNGNNGDENSTVLAASEPFEVVRISTTGSSSSSSCGGGGSGGGSEAPDPSTDDDVVALTTTIVQDARDDIAALIDDNPILVGKFLRLIFHDCVGGCDGCIDMTNFDNAGLVLPINALRPVVDKYEPTGVLSRTDIWMLSAVVASEVATSAVAVEGLEFPFQWVGRRTCEDLNGGSNCGRGADGTPSPCGPFGGPHRALCHGDIDGTTTIQQFMSNEFDFDAQETTAIMGAHSVGAMRAVNLGFEGRRGWDLTNNDLDRGYFIELVGSRNDPDSLPDWQQTLQNNDGLDGIPDRWQYEATVDGRPLTMLNSDVALVRNLVEGENLTPDGRVTCDFKGDNSCDDDTPFMPFVIRYAQDEDTFLSDYRDALNKMIDNGYVRDFRCPAEQVCTLRPR
mmetsp:Transcript_52473/g.127022  ORF Transcript_52473/g.127022 Transcript_52473/m.127022 type:complete len:577 (+) Transcript_52473:23-1753(+)